jgi:uncharacterized membrane protein YciS (DUF1049 family)
MSKKHVSRYRTSHEGVIFVLGQAFSWVTTKKHWPWSRLGGGKNTMVKKIKRQEKRNSSTCCHERVDFDKN